MRSDNLAKSWATLAGVVLVLVGVLGFINNPLVGAQQGALVPTDTVHNIVHLSTGLLALYIAFGLSGRTQINAVIGFGILYVIILIAVLASPTLFGLFAVPANVVLHIIHAVLAGVSLAVGFMSRSPGTMRTTN